MKTIGLIGGMSWQSTMHYYQIINEYIEQELGGFHSAKILMYSVDFDKIERNQREGNWEEVARLISFAAQSLEKGGADFILICTNTIHKVYQTIQESVSIPILHIADATMQALSCKKVALLGTLYTMTEDFYKSRLEEAGFEVLIPEKADREYINTVIFEELCKGIVKKESAQGFYRIIEDLKKEGAQGVILGCTEIGMLIEKRQACLPLYDTTYIHAISGAKKALE